MSLPISSISLSNTFGQWVVVTQRIVSELNALDEALRRGDFTKANGTFYIDSSNIALNVTNTAVFGSIIVSNTATFNGNVFFNGTIYGNANSFSIKGVEIKENSITFSTDTPRGNTLIAVNRGIGYTNAHIRWNEASKTWQSREVTSNNYFDIISANNTATTSRSGIVQLNDDFTGTSTTQAATINAVRKAYIAAIGGIGGTGIVNIIGTTGSAVGSNGVITMTSTNGMAIVGSGNTLTFNTPQNVSNSAVPSFASLELRNTSPILEFNDTTASTGRTFWINSNEGIFYLLANTTHTSPSSWNIAPATYNSSTKTWIFSANNTLIQGALKPVSIGNTTYKNVQVTNQTIENSEKLILNANNSTITLPASPDVGNFVTISVGEFSNTIIQRNGEKIMNKSEDLKIDIANVSITLLYANTEIGWKII